MSHHSHNHGVTSSGRLVTTLLLNILITVVEVVGGLWSGSLSLVSDALHNLSDGLSVGLTWGAMRLARRRRSARHTYGLRRAEPIAALINAATLVAVTVFLFQRAILRLLHPSPIDGRVMTAVALVGLAANVAGTLLLRSGSAHSLNVRSTYLHLLGDAASSGAVVLGGLAVTFWRIVWLDPVLTILIGLYVLRQCVALLSETVHVLMEGAPTGLDVEELRCAVEAFPDVDDLHHVHVWTVGEDDVHLSAHVNVRDMRISEGDRLRRSLETVLWQSFGVSHATLQLECGQCEGVGLIRT